MNPRPNVRRRLARRLLVGIAIGAGVMWAAGQQASAAVTATFSANTGVLSVFGDGLDNNIQISRNAAAGQILVNGGAVVVRGGTATVANTSLIQVFGQAGNDTITLNQANGALPRANLFGGAGNDLLAGGSGGDQLFGQSGNDTLLGQGGFDFLFGAARTTPSPVATPTTRCSGRLATTGWCGIPATTPTSTRAVPGPTPWR
jgi:Ca2+-binding RTX toxin-like protein